MNLNQASDVVFLSLVICHSLTSTLFPYTTLFRSPDRWRQTVQVGPPGQQTQVLVVINGDKGWQSASGRSEEHTSELQSRGHLVCRLLLEKKKSIKPSPPSTALCLTENDSYVLTSD